MTREYADFLDDMLAHARMAREFIDKIAWDQFATDAKTQFATARAIEIIGEAARRVPDHIQKRYPHIPWRQVIGMRNVLAHNYDGADPRIIFDTATLFLPSLIEHLTAIIDELDGEAAP